MLHIAGGIILGVLGLWLIFNHPRLILKVLVWFVVGVLALVLGIWGYVKYSNYVQEREEQAAAKLSAEIEANRTHTILVYTGAEGKSKTYIYDFPDTCKMGLRYTVLYFEDKYYGDGCSMVDAELVTTYWDREGRPSNFLVSELATIEYKGTNAPFMPQVN